MQYQGIFHGPTVAGFTVQRGHFQCWNSWGFLWQKRTKTPTRSKTKTPGCNPNWFPASYQVAGRNVWYPEGFPWRCWKRNKNILTRNGISKKLPAAPWISYVFIIQFCIATFSSEISQIEKPWKNNNQIQASQAHPCALWPFGILHARFHDWFDQFFGFDHLNHRQSPAFLARFGV